MEEASFTFLPEDILVNIFGRLDDYPCELPRLACVCSRFASLIASRCWKLKCLSAAPSLVADLLQPCVGEAHGFQDPPGGWSALHKLLFCCPGLLHAGVWDRAPGFPLGFAIASHALNGSTKHLSSNVEKPECNVDAASCSFIEKASFGYGEARVRCASSDNLTSGWKDASGHVLASRPMIEDGCARSMGRIGHGNELHDFALNMDKKDCEVSIASGCGTHSARQISDPKAALCQDETESQINEAEDFGSIQRIGHRNELRDLRIDAEDIRRETRLDTTYKQPQMAEKELVFENQSKRRKITRDGGPHLATGMWRFSREQGNKLLANRYRADSLYICDWPGCIHPGEKRNYKLFRGIFKKFKSSYVWKNLMDMKAPKSNMSCAFCSSGSTWDMVANFCLKRSIGSHKDGEPFVWAYVCENGHVAGAWTDRPLYNLQIC